MSVNGDRNIRSPACHERVVKREATVAEFLVQYTKIDEIVMEL